MKTINLFTGDIEELIQTLDRTVISIADEKRILNNEDCKFFMPSKSEALRLLQQGSPDLLAKFQEFEKLTFTTPIASKMAYQYETEGLFFSVPAYLEGQPEHWLIEQEEPAPGKVQDLYINISANWKTTEKTIFSKLVKIAQYVDAVEASGQRLNIFIYSYRMPTVNFSGKGKSNNTFLLQIKRDHEPVNLQQMVYLTASPAVQRFAIFWLSSVHYGYQFGQFVQDINQEIKMIADKSIMYIPSFYYDKQHDIHEIDYQTADIKELYSHIKSLIA